MVDDSAGGEGVSLYAAFMFGWESAVLNYLIEKFFSGLVFLWFAVRWGILFCYSCVVDSGKDGF